jgi:PAS domain S-box-containing protein
MPSAPNTPTEPVQPLWQALLARDPRRQPTWQRMAVAVVLTLAALWLRMAVAPAESGGRFITFSLAAALSTLVGGFRAGMLSVALGMVLANFFLVAPLLKPAIDDLTEALWLNAWHLITQLVVVGAIAQMQQRNRHLVQATEQARASQQHFLQTFEHAASGISHVSLDGRLMRVNQTFCQLVGYSADELMQLRFQDITHPDDVEPDLRMLQRTIAGQQKSYTLTKRYRHKQGHWVWAQLTVALIRRDDGAPDYFISVVQDLSSLKSAEQALRTTQNLLNQAQKLAHMGAWQADLVTWRITSLSPDAPFLDFTQNDYAISELLGFIHADDRERVQEAWRSALAGEQPYEIEYRVLIEGHEYWHAVKAEFERDNAGRAVRALGVTLDITERKRIELQVQQLNATLELRIQERTRELKAAYDELESYSYAVAHDLRSPLRIINGFAMALEEENPALDAAGRQHLQRIKGASAKMGQLIDGLLQLSQYARGGVQRHPVNLSAVATRMLEELAADEPQRNIGWQVDSGLAAMADPPLIEALLQNLLHNAWKYSAQTPQAHIRVYAEVQDGQRFFCVSDNGAGFDMARSGKLFQPFQRLHQPHEFSGLGIGLATARRIVQRHGGELRAESSPGQGATFRFTLPEQADSTGDLAS